MVKKASFVQIVQRVEELLHSAEKFQPVENTGDLHQKVTEGKKLVLKSKKLSGLCKIFKKLVYARKLHKVEKDVCHLVKYELNVDAREDTVIILEKLKEFQRNLLQSLAYSTFVVPGLPSLTVGFDLPSEDLKALLFQDEIYLVGVCAPGGCGKTTLVAKLCRDETVKSRFPDILFLAVSSSPKLLDIVQKLWVRLVDENEIPTFANDEVAIAQLMERLRQKKLDTVLIVLDDVWSESVLTKFNFKQANIKTIVTSRIKFQQFDSTYSVKMLEKDDARALFDHYAFPKGDVAQKPDEDLVNQIVDRCQGFALALKVLGGSLKDQQPSLWEKTIDLLKEGTQLFDAHKDFLDCLAPSIKSLEDKLYECYLDLGCFPENTKIPASALMDIWVETYGLSEDAAYEVLLEFSTRSLVTLHERYATTEVDRSVENLYVIQHTFLRDLAIYFSQHGIDIHLNKRLIMNEREETLPKNWSCLKDQDSQARIVSLHTGKMDHDNWPDVSFVECEALILHFSAENYCLPPFMGKMEKLKVLIVSNNNSNHTELKCISSQHLPRSIRRLRLEKVLVSVLPFKEGSLVSLHKFTLSSCRIADTENSFDYFTMLPSLVELEIDYCIDLVELPEGISCLTTLEKLSVRNCPDLVELSDALGNLVNLIELKLQGCVGIEALPSSICELQKLQFLDLSYCSMIEELPEDFGKLSSLEKLDMRSCSEIQYLPDSVTSMQSLKRVICDEETANLWFPKESTLNKVEVSIVKENPNLNWLS